MPRRKPLAARLLAGSGRVTVTAAQRSVVVEPGRIGGNEIAPPSLPRRRADVGALGR